MSRRLLPASPAAQGYRGSSSASPGGNASDGNAVDLSLYDAGPKTATRPARPATPWARSTPGRFGGHSGRFGPSRRRRRAGGWAAMGLALGAGAGLNGAVYNEPLDSSLVACPDCDLLQRLPALEPGASARCRRCDLELWRRRDDIHHRTLPLALAAAVLYVLANTFPMLGLEAVGHAASTTVLGGARQLWHDDLQVVAVLVFFAAVVAPGLRIGFMLGIELGLRLERLPRWVGTLLRHQPMARTWSMIEVMLIGVLVALIKIAELATVVPGIALYSLGALVFVMAAMQASFDPRQAWEQVEWAESATREAGLQGRAARATP
jgi:paraquat-inducible protein A